MTDEVSVAEEAPVPDQAPATEEPEDLFQPFIYQTMDEVPREWREMRGGRLNDVDQVNWIVRRAYEISNEMRLGDMHGNPVPAYGHARDEFAESHEIIDGVWQRTEDDA